MATAFARSALFVPGSRPERFAKALASGADLVIVDFEDAVEAHLKQQARHGLATFLGEHRQTRIMVRVNACDHPEHQADLAFCQQQSGVLGIVLPKADSAAQVALAAATGKVVWPIIETATGWLALAEIAGAPGVERLTFGTLDLALDLGLNRASVAGEAVLDQMRLALVLHSRANGLAAPLDSVYPAFDDAAGLRQAMLKAADMGMAGALCIHPRQIPILHAALAPTDDQLQWARNVLAAADGDVAAFQLDGQMVDAPVLARARRLLAKQPELTEK